MSIGFGNPKPHLRLLKNTILEFWTCSFGKCVFANMGHLLLIFKSILNIRTVPPLAIPLQVGGPICR